MLKLRLIAAAALATFMVPTMASAANPKHQKERAKYLVQLKDEIRINRDRIKAALQRGHTNVPRAELQQRLANLNSRLSELSERIQTIRDNRASS